MSKIHIALDFDKTLAQYDSWRGVTFLGEPIPVMLENVKEWPKKGYKISIFTARVSTAGHSQEESRLQKILISEWLKKYGLPELEITADKQPKFTHFVDDKAISVIPNKGVVSSPDFNL